MDKGKSDWHFAGRFVGEGMQCKWQLVGGCCSMLVPLVFGALDLVMSTRAEKDAHTAMMLPHIVT